MREKVSQLLEKTSRVNRKIEIAIIVISTITTGTLWATIGDVFPNLSIWAGAIMSTALTALTTYQKSFDPQKRYEEAWSLYREVGQVIAHLISGKEFDYSEVLSKHKDFDSRLLKITEGSPTSPV
jgi:hypothetical protein